jgi:hypothetical protein
VYCITSYSKDITKAQKFNLCIGFVLNESLNTINKGNGNKVSSVGIIVFHVEAA